ncbi:MAG: biotin carboxylase N-terminal domain-containing protein [Myxococcota bacterium]|nr:biotin carboxylase N-terminal domain-containing protein [Myxococcota bacterium]
MEMKILIANRGEIACRVLKTLRELDISSVAVYSPADENAPHVWLADEAFPLTNNRGYLDIGEIIEIAKENGVHGIHPGYGFLAENVKFAQACMDASITFIGPSMKSMSAFGDKREARILAESVGVSLIPGAEKCESPEDAQSIAGTLGYPILLKAAAGGGGKGMRRASCLDELDGAFESARREAESSFGDGRLLIEKYIYPARHIEVQVLGDSTGIHIVGERECSLQRRYQKVIEEAPASSITDETRSRLYRDVTKLLMAVGYEGAGTVEFLVGPDGSHYFLEVNTRLQVEHPVTEFITGMDLVAEQIRIAFGGLASAIPRPRGYAIEARLNAEDPYQGYLPQVGVLEGLSFPHWPQVRIDSGVEQGSEVTPHYDSMIAKVIAYGATRQEARNRLRGALLEISILGVRTNQHFLSDILDRDFFVAGETYTTTIDTETFEESAIPTFLEGLVAEAKSYKPTKSIGSEAEQSSPWVDLGRFRIG